MHLHGWVAPDLHKLTPGFRREVLNVQFLPTAMCFLEAYSGLLPALDFVAQISK